MDALASVGNALATPQLIGSVIAAFIMIGLGIYLVAFYTPIGSPMPGIPINEGWNSWQKKSATVGGSILIILGVIAPFGAWWRRKLIRSNPTLAAAAGAVDIMKMLKHI